MSLKILRMKCPTYQFNNELDLEKVAKDIDNILINNFRNQSVVLRGIQSEKHDLPKEQLIQQIISTGSDHHDSDNSNDVKVSDKQIDLFGLTCKISGSITLPILEGFHKWKPKSLEQPQRRVDIWMIYDITQLENIEYTHGFYGVKTRDGYVFKYPENQKNALLGILVID